MSKDATISLFCGAGGMSLGFTQAGLKPLVAADCNEDACSTYERNLGLRPFHTDLGDPSSDFLASIDSLREPLFLIGGPPCQGFSSAGQKNADDARNRLIFSYLGLVDRLRPKWFLFENVEGLLTSNKGESVFLLAKKFIELGYLIRIEKVNFASFGLPQGRKRVVILGNRMGVNFHFPAAKYSYDSGKHKYINGLPHGPTLADAIFPLGQASDRIEDEVSYASPEPMNDYDTLMREGSNGKFQQHSTTKPGTQAEAIAALKPGQTMKDLPEEYWHESFKRRAYRRVKDGTPTEKRGGAPSGLKRLQGQLASLTITSAAEREFIHPEFDRPLTYRECARLQSFPDCFKFCGNSQSIATQIGNAFPAIAARAFAEHVAEIDASFGADRSISRAGLIDYELTKAIAMSPALARTDALLASLSDKQSHLPLGSSVGV
jgi:DNA (cytosine-5)-methyltransferase 1